MGKKQRKYSIISLGCPKNTVDSEVIMSSMKQSGWCFSANAEDAELVIINTCAFIKDAKVESIETILDAVELSKKENQKLVVTGCLAKRYKREIIKEIPEIHALVDLKESYRIPDIAEKLTAAGNNERKFVIRGRKWHEDTQPYRSIFLTPAHTAYIKIAEGCNRRCSFCAIPGIRGRLRSRHPENIIREVVELLEKGTKEIILIAQDTTSFGRDTGFKGGLASLVQMMSGFGGKYWLRLMYFYPSGIGNSLIHVIANNETVCKYADIPLQHISQRILSSMRRGTGSRSIKRLINELRAGIPGLILRTSFIVGYPGETEDEFNELLEFIREMEFERLGVFEFSPEENTKAFSLDKRIPEEIIHQRFDLVMMEQMKISLNINRRLIGKIVKVLVEGKWKKGYWGRTQGDAPEIDQKVYIRAKKNNEKSLIGEFITVCIERAESYDLCGRIIDAENELTENE